MNFKFTLPWCLGLLLLISPNVEGEDQFLKGATQGTKFEFTFIEGDIDPASPEHAYVEINITTVRSLDIILAIRKESHKDQEQSIRSKRHRINATPGAPRKERFILYLDEIGLDSPSYGLMAILLRFPLSQFDQNLIIKYQSDGNRVLLEELPGQFL